MTAAAGRPITQNCGLSHASRRPVSRWKPISSTTPVTTAATITPRLSSMTLCRDNRDGHRALIAAGGSTRRDVDVRLHIEQLEEPRDGRRVETAERVCHRFADVAEDAVAEVERRRTLPHLETQPAATEAALHQPVGQAQDEARAQRIGSPLQQLALEPAHGLHGPL